MDLDTFPVSFAQQRLWFLDQLVPDSPLYNVPQAYRLKGTLDQWVFQEAIQEMAQRHETLRTTFDVVDGSQVQKIHPHASVSLELVDLSHLPEDEREIEAKHLATEEATRPFDLERGPLMRASLLRLGEEEHLLLLTFHHIVFDGWSSGVLLKELSAIYPALLEGRPSPLEPIEIQYADFSVWQRKWLEGEVLEEQLSYWRDQLEKAPSAIELPTDRPRPPVQSHKGAVHRFTLAPDLTEGLRTLARSGSATLFMVLLAGFGALLSRYSFRKDIVVGVPVAGRSRTEIEGLIGFFVNTLPLRCDLSGDSTFREFTASVREAALGAYAHQDLPFEKLVEELRPYRDLSRHPIFQVTFQLQIDQGLPSFSGVKVEPFRGDWNLSKFDLSLHVLDESDQLQAAFQYSTDLFDASTIEQMSTHLKVLLEAAVVDPELPLSKLPLLTEEECHKILYEWNDTKADFPEDRCVHQLFEEQVVRTPDAVAVVFENEQLTYSELNKKANQLAHHLKELGVGPETLVGICVERSIEMMVGLLGILKAGGAYVPLDPSYPGERLTFMLEDASAPVLLSQEHLLSRLPDHRDHLVLALLDAHRDEIAKRPSQNPDSDITPHNLAYVIYTSGSTGRPKGVMVEHEGIVNLAFWHQRVYGLTNEDRCTQVASLSFDACVWELWAPLLFGASVWIVPDKVRVDAGSVAGWIASNEITLCFLPTPVAEEVMERGNLHGCLRYLLTGGDRLTKRPSEETPFVLVNHYGPTENTVVSTAGDVPRDEEDSVPPIGRPISNIRIYILDEAMNPVPVRVVGEIYIGGVGLARGYLNRPELTAERFTQDPFSDDPTSRLYRTGDLARFLPDGNIEFVGRSDHQVKIRGFRVELGEIEAAFLKHPRVRDAVVLAREDHPGNMRLVAYLVAAEGSAPLRPELRAFLRNKLPDYMVPHAIVELESLPLTPNGKVDRDALPLPEHDNLASTAEYVAPRTETEKILVEIWQELLGIDKIGIHDNLFDLGGHSLLTVRVVMRAKRRGVILAPDLIFQFPTVAELACASRNLAPDGPKRPQERETREKDFPLLQLLERRGTM